MISVGLWWRTEAKSNTDLIHSFYKGRVSSENRFHQVLLHFCLTNLNQMRMNCIACFNIPPIYLHILAAYLLTCSWALRPSHLGSHGRMPTKPNGKGHEGERDAQAIPKSRL